MPNIYLLRHCDYANPRNILPGRLPVELSQKGRKRALELREEFAQKKIKRIYSSAVLRCKQTAEIIANGVIPIEYDQRLLETHSAYQGFWVENAETDWRDFFAHKNELGGEGLQDIYLRVSHFYRELLEKIETEGDYLICSHGDPLMALQHFIQARPLPDDFVHVENLFGWLEKGEWALIKAQRLLAGASVMTELQSRKDQHELGIPEDYIVTDRPFFHSSVYLSKVMGVDMSQQARELGLQESDDFFRLPLGFKQQELDQWLKNRDPLLEVGPGLGSSCQELAEAGFAIYALEPSYSKTERRSFLTALAREGRVSLALAKDAVSAFPTVKFEVIFAQGNNFQAYSRSPKSVAESIAGLLRSLRCSPKAFLTFQLSSNGQTELMDRGALEFDTYSAYSRPRASSWLELGKILDLLSIRYEIRKSWSGMRQSRAIRIFSESEEGVFSTERLTAFLKTNDISRFVLESKQYG